MESNSSSITKYVDKILNVVFLWAVPIWIKPNHFTVLRFVSVPFILYLLIREDYAWGVVIFGLSAFTDAIDGALARTRNQITEWGRIFDPLADKVLIATSALVVLSKFDSVAAFSMIFLDVAIGAAAFYHLRAKKEIVNPHWTGKVKMILQSVGVVVALIFLITGIPEIEAIARAVIYFAIGLGLISVAVYRSA